MEEPCLRVCLFELSCSSWICPLSSRVPEFMAFAAVAITMRHTANSPQCLQGAFSHSVFESCLPGSIPISHDHGSRGNLAAFTLAPFSSFSHRCLHQLLFLLISCLWKCPFLCRIPQGALLWEHRSLQCLMLCLYRCLLGLRTWAGPVGIGRL
jgi:hypothetical protein